VYKIVAWVELPRDWVRRIQPIITVAYVYIMRAELFSRRDAQARDTGLTVRSRCSMSRHSQFSSILSMPAVATRLSGFRNLTSLWDRRPSRVGCAASGRVCRLYENLSSLNHIDRKFANVYLSATMQCAAKIVMNGDPVRYQWYDIWSSAVAVLWMCINQGKGGRGIMNGVCPKDELFILALLT